MDDTPSVLSWLHNCADRMEQLAESTVEVNGTRALRSALHVEEIAVAAAPPYPVFQAVERLTDSVLGRAFSPIARDLPWRESDRTTDAGIETVVCELTEHLGSVDVRVGLTLLQANCRYPIHQHPPQELYYVISGEAMWRFGGATDERSVPADSLLYNHPDDLHSMACGEQPLLALWVLWEN